MYAVVEAGGTQHTVEEGMTVRMSQMDGAAGDKNTLDKVLLISDGQTPQVGTPYIQNASVEAELVAQGKAPKTLSFKYKRRTKYRRTMGHRQPFTELKITKINIP